MRSAADHPDEVVLCVHFHFWCTRNRDGNAPEMEVEMFHKFRLEMIYQTKTAIKISTFKTFKHENQYQMDEN